MASPSAALGGTSDSFDDYVADLDLLDSDQARNPEHTIRYADRKYGALLKSVLDPSRAQAMLTIYFQQALRGKQPPNVAGLLGSILHRYGMAFQKRPRDYESEYLDCLDDEESTAEIGLPAISAAISALSTQRARAAMETLRRRGLDLGAMKKILLSSYGIIGVACAAEAKILRRQIADHMFSDGGAKRAQRIANRLMRIAAPYLPAPVIKIG